MKKLFTLALLMCFTAGAFAQFMNTGNGSGSNGGGLENDCSSYNQFLFSYTNNTFSSEAFDDYDDEELWGTKFNGFSIAYLHAFSLSSKLPMFLETGIEWGMGFAASELDDCDFMLDEEEVEGEYKDTRTMMNLTVPLNFVYKFKFNDFAIKPYTGFYIKANVMAQGQTKLYDEDGKNVTNQYNNEMKEYYEEYFDEEYEPITNFLDKKEMDKYVWSVIQGGWQIGVLFDYKNLTLGVGYALDFNPIYKTQMWVKKKEDYKKVPVNTGTLAVRLGVNF